jgi:hypothetical protein
MYCIGWKPKANCTKEVELPNGNSACPSVKWFWITAASVLVFAAMGKGKR